MVQKNRIQTARLDLIPATPGMLRCEGTDPNRLGELIDAKIPPSWPPPLLDPETIDQFISILSGNRDPHFCSWYWVLDATPPSGRVLVGSGGTASCPGACCAVVIGYSVLEEYQRRGYATEAVGGLIGAVFSDPSIAQICATTYPELKASIRVLEKNQFLPAAPVAGGEGIAEGTLLFVRARIPEEQ